MKKKNSYNKKSKSFLLSSIIRSQCSFLLLFILSFDITGAEPENQIFLTLEDDAGNSDRYYTGGIRIDYHTKNQLTFLDPFFSPLQFFYKKSMRNHESQQSMSAGLEAYTPLNIQKSDAAYGDRPYAGRSYLAAGNTIFNSSKSAVTEIELGNIGPGSGAADIQKKIHYGIDSPQPRGWKNQIQQFTTLNLRHEVKSFWNSFSGYTAGIRLGNALTDATFSLVLRAGKVDTNPGPAYSMLNPGHGVLMYKEQKSYWYFFMNPGVTFQAFNGSIQGMPGSENTFRSEKKENIFSNDIVFLSNGVSNDPYLSRYLLNNLVIDSGSNTTNRYNLFSELFLKNTTNPYGIGMNFILFNNIFNGAENIGKTLKAQIINSLIIDRDKLTPEATYVAYDAFKRKPGDRLSLDARYYSYSILSQYMIHPGTRTAFQYLLIHNYTFLRNRNYTALPRPAVPFLRMGFHLYASESFFVGLSHHLSLTDFEAPVLLPKFHQWTALQAAAFY